MPLRTQFSRAAAISGACEANLCPLLGLRVVDEQTCASSESDCPSIRVMMVVGPAWLRSVAGSNVPSRACAEGTALDRRRSLGFVESFTPVMAYRDLRAESSDSDFDGCTSGLGACTSFGL